MANFLAHSDWIFEHSLHDLHDHQSSILAPQSSESGWTASGDGAAGLLKALWHQGDMPNGGGSSGLATSQLALLHPSVQSSGGDPSPQAPSVTITSNALTVTEGGSVALPISVSPVTQGDPLLVTIKGLASYETLTDGLDHHVFSGDSVTLTGAEVASGLTLASNYTGPGHPVNTLSVTASESMDHHVLTSAAQTITVTDPPATSGSSTGNPLTLVVNGDNLNGTDPQFQVFVDGQQVGGTFTATADHAAGQTQTVTINGNFDPTVAHQVQVQLINDAWDGTQWWTNGTPPDGHDVNLYVESISLNGTTMTGVQGTNGATNGIAPAANSHEAVLDVNGALSFNVPADPPPTSGTVTGGTVNTGSGGSGTSSGTSTSTGTGGTGNPLTLVVNGDNLNGTDPMFQVFVDGHQVGGTFTATADHASGQTQTVTINGNFDPTVAHQVQVQLINDAWDGQLGDGHDVNLYVESISLNGTTLTGVQGTDNATNGVVHAANANEAVLDVNGALSVNVPADPPGGAGTTTTTTTSGGTVTGGTVNTGSSGSGTSSGTGTSTGTGGTGNPLTLVVSGDNLNGTDPQFQVFVDGQQVGGTFTVTADHASGQTQTVTINGNFDPTVAHQVQVQFINDAWDGQLGDGHDVNLYVESISLNGTTGTGVQGTNGATNGVVQAANANEAVMDVNGTLSFNVSADPPGSSGIVTGGTVNTGSGGSGTSGGSSSTAGTGFGAAPSGPGFFVSPNGNDSNAGTVDAPFATLERAQQAMENSSIKQTYVEGGTYHQSSSLTLTSADNGETWTYYPPSGIDTAVIDGGGSVDNLINVFASNVTINGLQFEHATNAGVALEGPNHTGGLVSDHNTIINNVFHDITNIDGAPVAIWGATNTKIFNNLIYNVTSKGIGVETWAGDSSSGTDIENNVLLNTVTSNSDNGAIYLQDLNGGSSTNITIKNNFIRDYGSAGNFTKAIYLDDGASNATITGNIISGSGDFALQYHGGDNNHVSGNIIDLGSAGNQFIGFYQMSPSQTINNMSGNTFTGNVVIGGGGSQVQSWQTNIGGQDLPTDSNNVYHNYGSGGISTGAAGLNDSNPIFENPQLSGWTYTTAAGSPVQIAGGWGPSGFIIPQTGTAPSV